MRPFHTAYWPGPKWYRWWDFGNGTMSDLGSHWNDLPWWALKLDAPKTVEAFGPPPHPEIAPASMKAVYTYGPRGDMPALTYTWYQGEMKPKPLTDGTLPEKHTGKINKGMGGMLFIGSKGMLLADYKSHILLPEDKFKEYPRPPRTLENVPNEDHQGEWLTACKTGSKTGSPFDTYAGPLTEANHLGNVAYRAGKKLEWDAKAMRIPNAPDAERFLKRSYRQGWSLGAEVG